MPKVITCISIKGGEHCIAGPDSARTRPDGEWVERYIIEGENLCINRRIGWILPEGQSWFVDTGYTTPQCYPSYMLHKTERNAIEMALNLLYRREHGRSLRQMFEDKMRIGLEIRLQAIDHEGNI